MMTPMLRGRPRALPTSRDQRELLFRAIRILATDVDGTLTTGGHLTSPVVSEIERLTAAGIEVIPVSGRAAGEVLGLVRYLPGVTRGIAENGQVLVRADHPLVWLAPAADRERLRTVAAEVAGKCGDRLELAPDEFCRVGDVAYERAERTDDAIQRLALEARARGVEVVWSSVHIHFSVARPDKGSALLAALDGGNTSPMSVATMGDAPNDAGLFVAGRFGVPVGTSDVLVHRDHMAALPDWVCVEREGAAFLELAEAIMESR